MEKKLSTVDKKITKNPLFLMLDKKKWIKMDRDKDVIGRKTQQQYISS